MKNRKSLRVYIGPSEIAGFYYNLALGLRSHGVVCDFLPLFCHPFQYRQVNRPPILVRLLQALNSYKNTDRWRLPLKVVSVILAELIAILWVFICLFRYDVFIFSFGGSLLRGNLDLPILRFFNKIIISNIAHGSEARPPYMSGDQQDVDGKELYSPKELLVYTKKVYRRVRVTEKYASYVLGAPASSSPFGIRKQINNFALGVPCQVDSLKTKKGPIAEHVNDKRKNKAVVILHSPSHPFLKGTQIIKQAVDNLKQSDYLIDFRMVTGVPHDVVMQQMRECDFVVDQVYSDTPLAGLGIEAAWHSKACVVGGYDFNWIKKNIPDEMVPISYTCKPDEIEDAIRNLLDNPQERIDLGRQSYDFVADRWHRDHVAKRWLAIIQGNIPEDWWIAPCELTYPYGAGQNIDRTCYLVRQQVDLFGEKSLFLSHNPKLERVVLDMAYKGLSDD